MEQLATSKGYTIENSRTPAYDFIHAVKEDVKIHIATLSQNESKIANYTEFEKDLENPQDYQIHESCVPEWLVD